MPRPSDGTSKASTIRLRLHGDAARPDLLLIVGGIGAERCRAAITAAQARDLFGALGELLSAATR